MIPPMILALALASCQRPADMEITSTLKQEVFGNMPDGREVKIFTLTNRNGLTARVTEYGAILVSMETPDKAGKTADITHGYDTLEGRRHACLRWAMGFHRRLGSARARHGYEKLAKSSRCRVVQ